MTDTGLSSMTKVRVLFFSPPSLIGRVISFVTKSRFSHVGIQIGDKYYEEVNEGFREGEPRTDYAAVYEVYAYPTVGVMRFLSSTVGQRYSFTTILADLIAAYTPYKWQIEASGEHVCSGAVAWILCLLGTLPFENVGFQPDAVTPGQLAELLGVK